MKKEPSPSYERINYSLRPAKSIERKMLCESFGRLHPFQHVSHYGYVGFGSLYFSDFSLIHNLLGICNMTSIEKETDAQERFQHNRPFQCITLEFDSSEIILPKIDWSRRNIVWLDYDGQLTLPVLGDIATVVNKAASGTMLVVSVNANPEREPSEQFRQSYQAKNGKPLNSADYRLSKLQKSLGDKVPYGTTGKELRDSGVAQVFRKIMLNEIADQLSVLNKALEKDQKLAFQQVLNFEYSDGARMLTIGGVLFNESERSQFDACQFEELAFARLDKQSYEILAPRLTPREIRRLNAQLPTADYHTLDCGGVPLEDVRHYAEIYRYFPAYHEVMFM